MADQSSDETPTQQTNTLLLATHTSVDVDVPVDSSVQEQGTSLLSVLTSDVDLPSVEMDFIETAPNSQSSVPTVTESSVELRAPASFNILPVEIRLKIWEYSMKPRIVRVRVSTITSFYIGHGRYVFKKFSSRLPVPAILHICRESRVEGLKMYKLCFGTELETDGRDFKFYFATRPKTYFSYALDTVNFKIEHPTSCDDDDFIPLKYMTQVDVDSIRSLSTSHWGNMLRLHPNLILFWRAELLKSLEEIVLPAKLYNNKTEVNPTWSVKEIPGDSKEDECEARHQLIEAARIRPEFCPKMWSMKFVSEEEFEKMLEAAGNR